MSCSGPGLQDLSTPAKENNPFEGLNPKGSRKRKQIDFTCEKIKEGINIQQASASPILKKSKEMPACRSPVQIPSRQGQSLPMDTDAAAPPPRELQLQSGPLLPGSSVTSASAPALIDPSFLSKMDQKMDLLTSGMMSISSRVDDHGKKLGENSELIAAQATEIKANASNIAEIFKRLELLGNAAPLPPSSRGSSVERVTAATQSPEYSRARRSLRLWPITASTEVEMWGGVGDFLQDLLGLSDDEVRQEDIDSIKRVADPVAAGTVRDEVLIVFNSAETRDTVMMRANQLAGRVDASGAPTAGIRLEVPPELVPTFRLLSRFGARLRARHGEGTKRHIKFDDFNASLYAVVKLPGDQSWTRVSPETARKDLEASFRKEEESTQIRLAAKLLPDPRERLRQAQAKPQRMLGAPAPAGNNNERMQDARAVQRPRLRWGIPGWKKGAKE